MWTADGETILRSLCGLDIEGLFDELDYRFVLCSLGCLFQEIMNCQTQVQRIVNSC